MVRRVFPYGSVKLVSKDRSLFQTNGHYLKHYYGEEDRDVEEIAISPHLRPTKDVKEALLGRQP